MDVALLFKIAGVGIIVAVLSTVLKQAGKDEQGQMVALVGVLIVLMMVVSLLGTFFTQVAWTFNFR